MFERPETSKLVVEKFLAAARHAHAINESISGNYQALFNLEILEDAFIGLVNNVAEAAIWTAFCCQRLSACCCPALSPALAALMRSTAMEMCSFNSVVSCCPAAAP